MARVYVIRHGKAEPEGSRPRDAERPLMDLGVAQIEALVDLLRSVGAGSSPLRIIASDYVRARQTAEILAKGLNAPVEFSPALRVGYRAEPALDVLRSALSRLPSQEDIAIVGHNPQLSEVTALLAKSFIEPLKTGEAVAFDAPTGSIEGMTMVLRLRAEE